MPSEPTIREYRRADRKAVLDITGNTFAGACMDYMMEKHFGRIAHTSWQERKRRGVDYDLRQNPEHVLIAELDGTVIGYVCNRIYRSESTGHIANLAVDGRHQGHGVGKMLIRASLDYFRSMGMKYARIEALDQNATGMHLYPAFGFKEIGRQIYFLREL
jgi:ribosomal protein S18 acetylase RimI-like enzyme